MMYHAKRPLGFICLEAAAKLLKKRHCITGPHLIFKQLRKLGWLEGHAANEKQIRSGMLAESNGWLDNGSGYTRTWLSSKALDELALLLPVLQEVQEVKLGIQGGKWGF